MKNLARHIDENCRDKTTEGIVRFLFKNGDLSYKSESSREIYFFYVDCKRMLGSKKEARDTTLEFFKVTWKQFNKIRKRFEN